MEIVSCRGFEKVCRIEFEKSETHIDYDELELPKRATKFAAGYDIKSTLNFTLKPGEDIVIPTGFKAYMQPGEMLALFPRSGMGFKYQIQLANTVGIGDGDYYNCESNEGHYFIKLVNRGKKDWEVKVGDGIGQAIFMPVLLADDDDFESGEERKGGFGSTDKLETDSIDVVDYCHSIMNNIDPKTNTVIDECHELMNNNSESLFTIFEDDYMELKNSDIGKVGLDILDNIKTKLINNELDSHCIGLLGHLMGKDKLNELLQKLTNSEFYEVVDGNNFIALPNNNSLQKECQGILSSKAQEIGITEMYTPKLNGFTATPIRAEDKNIDVPALVKEYIDKNTGDIVHIHDGLKVGQPVLACDRNKTKIYYVGVLNSINKKDNTLCVTTHLLNGKDEIEIYKVNDPKITMLTYKSPEDISRPEPSRSIKINTVKYLDVKDIVCVTFAFSKEILCAGEISKIEGDKISILVAPDLNERGNVVVDLNTKELSIYKKCAYETLESIYPEIDVKSATSYFKHNLFTEVKDIQTLKKGNLIFGVEQYGPKRRVCSGMVDDIYPEYAYVMANDSYNGARGTHINTEYGKIFKISLEDIPNGTFKNKVIDYIIEEVNTK
ncbi:dCTP deaminase/dUTPase family protein [Paraclostridium bifermentans]|uniref:hypothetical protein n=1 Tax=Paraclostridium bifermentans TaxID=1490 RepID=UPI00374EBC43